MLQNKWLLNANTHTHTHPFGKMLIHYNEGKKWNPMFAKRISLASFKTLHRPLYNFYGCNESEGKKNSLANLFKHKVCEPFFPYSQSSCPMWIVIIIFVERRRKLYDRAKKCTWEELQRKSEKESSLRKQTCPRYEKKTQAFVVPSVLVHLGVGHKAAKNATAKSINFDSFSVVVVLVCPSIFISCALLISISCSIFWIYCHRYDFVSEMVLCWFWTTFEIQYINTERDRQRKLKQICPRKIDDINKW